MLALELTQVMCVVIFNLPSCKYWVDTKTTRSRPSHIFKSPRKGLFLFTKYCMGQFAQILLLVTVIYLTVVLSVKTMFGDYTRLFAIMTAMLVTCMVALTTAVSWSEIYLGRKSHNSQAGNLGVNPWMLMSTGTWIVQPGPIWIFGSCRIACLACMVMWTSLLVSLHWMASRPQTFADLVDRYS